LTRETQFLAGGSAGRRPRASSLTGTVGLTCRVVMTSVRTTKLPSNSTPRWATSVMPTSPRTRPSSAGPGGSSSNSITTSPRPAGLAAYPRPASAKVGRAWHPLVLAPSTQPPVSITPPIPPPPPSTPPIARPPGGSLLVPAAPSAAPNLLPSSNAASQISRPSSAISPRPPRHPPPPSMPSSLRQPPAPPAQRSHPRPPPPPPLPPPDAGVVTTRQLLARFYASAPSVGELRGKGVQAWLQEQWDTLHAWCASPAAHLPSPHCSPALVPAAVRAHTAGGRGCTLLTSPAHRCCTHVAGAAPSHTTSTARASASKLRVPRRTRPSRVLASSRRTRPSSSTWPRSATWRSSRRSMSARLEPSLATAAMRGHGLFARRRPTTRARAHPCQRGMRSRVLVRRCSVC
jgi:hypothetical protein